MAIVLVAAFEPSHYARAMHRFLSLFKNRRFLLACVLIAVLLTIGIDQSLKRWAGELAEPVERMGMVFFPFGNNGILGGYLADLDPWIVRIFFSVLFGFLCLGAILLIHFLRNQDTPWLKSGLIVYLAGVFGNVWDRMTTGTVVDYIIFPLPWLDGIAFNFADGVVAIGFVLIAGAIFKEADELWYNENQRRGYWIEPRFQKSFAALVALVGFAHFVVIALYSFVFIKVFVSPDASASAMGAERILRDYFFGLAVIEGAALVLTVAASVVFSHRMVGPLFALENHVELLATREPDEKIFPFRVRRSDYFRSVLESIVSKIERIQKPAE